MVALITIVFFIYHSYTLCSRQVTFPMFYLTVKLSTSTSTSFENETLSNWIMIIVIIIVVYISVPDWLSFETDNNNY